MNEIGFIQGRLSDIIDNKIQAFPWENWREEFNCASQYGFSLMEWTLDNDKLNENPLLTNVGKREIELLSAEYNVKIGSVTGDCFMQSPFWKMDGTSRDDAIKDLVSIIESMAVLSIKYLVVPLVDNGSIENSEQENNLIEGLETIKNVLKETNVLIVFESDLPPNKLKCFINKFDESLFGINYDIGNSAALDYDPTEEITTYGNHIYNVHVKDRVLGGTTVALGDGNADLSSVFSLLNNIDYRGNYILQTARAKNNDHAIVLCEYRNMVKQFISKT